ncbi:MAG: response regulator [Kineosporiaceae bacterium]
MRETPNGVPTSRPRLTVVVVEDHAGVREQLVALMQDEGIDVLAAVTTVHAGYEAVAANHPDVAVLDNRLPDGLGIDLCRTLTAELPGVRVVLHAGAMTADEERAAVAAGAAAVVQKSVRADTLIHAVRALAAPVAR